MVSAVDFPNQGDEPCLPNPTNKAAKLGLTASRLPATRTADGHASARNGRRAGGTHTTRSSKRVGPINRSNDPTTFKAGGLTMNPGTLPMVNCKLVGEEGNAFAILG